MMNRNNKIKVEQQQLKWRGKIYGLWRKGKHKYTETYGPGPVDDIKQF
jgi:hypothetical protein